MIQSIPQDEVVSISQFKDITKAYKFDMKLTKNKEVLSNQTLSTCRHLYNDILDERKRGYENGGWNVQYNDQQNYLPEMRNRNDETGKYLREVYEQVEQNVIKRVDIAYQNFFRRVKNNKEGSNGEYKKPGHPRFKGYGRYDSFTFPQYGYGCQIVDKYGNKNEKGDIIRLSKIGDIKFIKHRIIGDGLPYLIKTVTIKKEIDKWFVIFTIETFSEIEVPTDTYKERNRINSIEELNKKCIGIDMGLSNLITISNRQKIEPPKYLIESEKKLAKEQKRLSRKKRYDVIDKDGNVMINKRTGKKITKYSKNGKKQKIKVTKIHRKIANQRRNFSHEVSRFLVNNFDLIIFEDLNIQKMMSNHHFAKSIADASWYQIQIFTSYKAEWAGKMTDFIVAKNTTKECSKCHKINDMPIWKRIMECSCGNIEDRDVDASFVIRDRSIYYQKLKNDILDKLNIESIKNKENEITPGTGGRACLSSLNRDAMIQEAVPFRVQ